MTRPTSTTRSNSLMGTRLIILMAKYPDFTSQTNTTQGPKLVSPRPLWGLPKQTQGRQPAPAYKPQLACGGSIWDEDLHKWAAYRDLIKHPKTHVQELWLKSGEDEFGHLFQGFQNNHIEGMDVLDWIRRQEVPIHKKVTYPRYTVAIRPEKADPYRTRITAGGDQFIGILNQA
eukprot:jgi/Psemu1/30035/gm1.30035_g